jgi:hypothetical protein
MKQGFELNDARKPYEPPKVVAISLRPEEAVLGGCKTASVAGPVSFACTNLGGCNEARS